jgi:hypothetical protein
MNSIKLISLNICNDDDLIYGSDGITEYDIDKFIRYHQIQDNDLICDIYKLFNSRLRTKLDNNIVIVDDNSAINYLHKSIISYYVNDEKLRSIQINLETKIRYINNLEPSIVDNFMYEKKKLLIESIIESKTNFVLLQEVDSHYMLTQDDMNKKLLDYNIISPLDAIQSYQKMMPGMLNNFIIYKKSPMITFDQANLKEYGTIGEFIINDKRIKIISGRWYPLKNNTYLRLKQLEMLDKETGKIIFMGDTNLRHNEKITTYNVSDAIIEYNFSKYFTINKNVNKYFNDDYTYVSRYDRIYSNGVDLIDSDLCFNTSHEKLKNIYRNSGFISDHFGLIAEFYLS